MGNRVFQQGPKHEAEADSQVHIDGLYEAVGVGKRSAGPNHQRSHRQHCGHSWENRLAMFPYQWPVNLPPLPGRLSPFEAWQGGDRTQKWNIARFENSAASWNRVDLSIFYRYESHSFLNVLPSGFLLEGAVWQAKKLTIDHPVTILPYLSL